MVSPGAVRTALERCVGEVDQFLEQMWGRAPLLRSGADPDSFRDLLTLEVVDEILSTIALDPGALRLVRDGATVPPSSYTRIGRGKSGGTLDAVRVFQEFALGATIGFQSLHLFRPPLASFCRDLEAELGHPAQTNAYVTPPSERGLAMHRDDHHVFALQLAGTKRWRVFAPDATRDSPGEPTIDATLSAGDCLYIPMGFLHVAETLDEVSLHLAVGVRPYLWRRALDELAALAEEDGVFGTSLPIRFATDTEGLGRGVEGWLSELRDWLGEMDGRRIADRLQRQFLTRRPTALSGQLFQALWASSLDDHTVVKTRQGATWAVVPAGGGEVSLLLADRELRMPDRLTHALQVLLQAGTVCIGDLDPHLDPESRLVLVRRLIGEGLLEVVPPPETEA